MAFNTAKLRNDNKPLDNENRDKYEVYLIGNTGIGQGNYIAFPSIGKSKEGVDQYFQSRRLTLPDAYTQALQDLSEIKIGSAFGRPNQIHISVPWEVLTNVGIEYIGFKGRKWDNIQGQQDKDRTFYAIVSDFSPVNSNSTRITFNVDYVASYWDKLNLDPDHGFACPIVRRSEASCKDDPNFDEIYTSQQTDGLSLPNITYKYDVKSAVSTEANADVQDFKQHYPDASTLELITRSIFDLETSKVSVQSMTDISGNLTGVFMNYQSGSNIGGFLYSFYLSDDVGEPLSRFLNNVVITFSRSAFSMAQPFLSVLKGMYLLPQEVADNCSKVSYVSSNNMEGGSVDYSYPAKVRTFSNAWNAWNDLVKRTNVNDNPKQALRYKANLVLHNLDSISQMVGLKDLEKLQNNKVMNYITYTVRTAIGEMEFSPFALNSNHVALAGYGTRPIAEMIFELFGGPTGMMKTTLLTRGYDYSTALPARGSDVYNVSLSPNAVMTPNWPKLSVAGSQTDHLAFTAEDQQRMRDKISQDTQQNGDFMSRVMDSVGQGGAY